MSETPNYGLYVEDDFSTRFQIWQQKMNGTNNSNMTKIDGILKDKADNSAIVSATLSASKWIGSSSPYTQEVAIAGLTADGNGSVGLAHSATKDQRNEASTARLSVIGQAEGKLTIVADGEDVPTMDIPIIVILID